MATVRSFTESDAELVRLLMTACTHELREVYSPKSNNPADPVSRPSLSSRVVAVDCTGTVVGVAEYIQHPSVLYVQGLAVAPTHQRSGVASDLLTHIAWLALDKGLCEVKLATIKETGNVEIFCRLGFAATGEKILERFLGQNGEPVTEVTLKRHVV